MDTLCIRVIVNFIEVVVLGLNDYDEDDGEYESSQGNDDDEDDDEEDAED